MSIKLKVCGMRDPENIREVEDVKPDFMGFIFYNRSPRWVSDNFVMPSLSESIKKTGVFVNENVDRIIEIVNTHNLDLVQLHGDESSEFCEKVRAEGIQVIKVFSVDKDFDFKTTYSYQRAVDYFLFDTKGESRGGNSVAFDWDLLTQYDQRVPFFLSGGITHENVAHVSKLKDMNLFAIDVNSGVEIKPGLKDIKKLILLKESMTSLIPNA